MTKPATHSGYYVTARDGGAGKTAWLCGPFLTHPAALAMVPAVTYAARHRLTDPRFQFASYGTAKLTVAADKQLPAGTLDISKSVDDVWIAKVINHGTR